MTDEQELILQYQDKPYTLLRGFLLSKKYRIISSGSDRLHKLNKVVFIAHDRTKHVKVSVWHLWLDTDQYGICHPGLITDIDVKDLKPKEEENVRTN